MALPLFLAVLALMVVFLVGPSWLVRWMQQDTPQASAATVSPPVPAIRGPAGPDPAGPDPEEELMERILTGERLAGILSPEDYQRAMAVLAAQDAVSHPMVVPPERL
jgi:hypothetical protein